MSQPAPSQIFTKLTYPCWFERAYLHHRPFLYDTTPDFYDFPFPQNGVPNASRRTDFAMRAATWRIWYRQDSFCIRAMSFLAKLLWPLCARVARTFEWTITWRSKCFAATSPRPVYSVGPVWSVGDL